MSALASPEPLEPRPDPPGRSASAPALGHVLATHTVADRTRVLLALRAAHGSSLVVDEDASGSDRRLLAHIAANEPQDSISSLVSDFLARPPDDRVARRVEPPDWVGPADGIGAPTPMGEAVLWDRESGRARLAHRGYGVASWHAESDDGLLSHSMTLEWVAKRYGVPAARIATASLLPSLIPDMSRTLRREVEELSPGDPFDDLTATLLTRSLEPCRLDATGDRIRWLINERPVTVRGVCGAMESYEPVVGMTRLAIVRWASRAWVLRRELTDVEKVRTTLNRGLRERFLAMARSDPRVTLSEVARRCGRVRDARGGVPDTSWLSRRLGLKPSSGEAEPTPWIAPAVLTQIAIEGLGIDPSEVELA